MAPQLQIEFAGMCFELTLDQNGIDWKGLPRNQFVAWNQVTGALRLKEDPLHGLSPTDIPAPFLQRIGGSEGVAKLMELRDRYGLIRIAYRESHGSKETIDVPYDKSNPVVMSELQSYLGDRWLGEAADNQVASKKLRLDPGFLKVSFFFIVFLLLLAVAAVLAFGMLLGPAFNLLSIQRMLLNLQDGDYRAFGTSFSVYAALFLLAYLARRAWKTRWSARQVRSSAMHTRFPFHPPQNFS